MDSVTNVLKTIGAIVFHLNTHGDTSSTSSVDYLRRSLPRNYDVPADEITLAAGNVAGLYIEAYEIGELADYPGDIYQGFLLKKNAPPDDVLKVK
jgi:hypothetical protein